MISMPQSRKLLSSPQSRPEVAWFGRGGVLEVAEEGP